MLLYPSFELLVLFVGNEEHDPYIWKCDSCGKEKLYTQKEIDTTHKPWPDPENHDRDYYVTCPFCNKGVMDPPTFVSFLGAFNNKYPPVPYKKYLQSSPLKFLSKDTGSVK